MASNYAFTCFLVEMIQIANPPPKKNIITFALGRVQYIGYVAGDAINGLSKAIIF